MAYASSPPGYPSCASKPSTSKSSGARAPLRVGIVLADNFTLSAFALFIDHLRLAADEGDRSRPLNVQWSIMASRPDPLRASCGVLTTPTSNFLDPSELDYLAVVGGVLHGGRQIDEATERYIKRAADAGVKLIGMCTGSFILCRIGLMKGRRACVSWYHYQDFLDEFPGHDVVADRLFLADGDRITCAGGRRRRRPRQLSDRAARRLVRGAEGEPSAAVRPQPRRGGGSAAPADVGAGR